MYIMRQLLLRRAAYTCMSRAYIYTCISCVNSSSPAPQDQLFELPSTTSSAAHDASAARLGRLVVRLPALLCYSVRHKTEFSESGR